MLQKIINFRKKLNNKSFKWGLKHKKTIKNIPKFLIICLDIGIKFCMLYFMGYILIQNLNNIWLWIITIDLFITYINHLWGYFKK